MRSSPRTCASWCASVSSPAIRTGRCSDFLVQRYGEFVLLKPAFGAHTLLLWLTPALVLILGGIGAYAALRRRPQSAAAALDADEERKLEELLKRDQV